MALKFGTSGVRGLVTEMTDRECYLYARAFLRYLKAKTQPKRVALAGDLRSSTPRIMKAVAYAVAEEGMLLDHCGFISTPAVTYHAMQNEMASVMVTGSHIPDDRNGIKFNMPWGEVLKEDEGHISALCAELREQDAALPRDANAPFDAQCMLNPDFVPELDAPNPDALNEYIKRYIAFFPENCLAGRKIVCYEHSSVSRDLLTELLARLGAEVVPVGRSDTFVPVDTEAVAEPDRLAAWVKEHGADALATTDGDGDRPLLVDDCGAVIRGDLLGILVASYLNADSMSIPVSCNTAAEKCERFANVSRTRIGSPYVIASMQAAQASGAKVVVGYEANGGFLTASDVTNPDTGTVLKALPTRDALLPLLAALHGAVKAAKPLSATVAELPPRYTFSGLLREFPNALGKRVIERFKAEKRSFAAPFLAETFGAIAGFDFTDGARITFEDGNIVHFRPSGNAPEFRCYTESDTEQIAIANNGKALAILRDQVLPAMEGLEK